MVKKTYPLKKCLSPFQELAGVSFTKVENGFSRCVLKVGEKHLNAYDTVDDGTIFTLADSGMMAALCSRIQEDESYAVIESKFFHFKPVKSGTLACNSKIINYNQVIAVLESEIKNRGRLVAKVTGTWSVFKARNKLNA